MDRIIRPNTKLLAIVKGLFFSYIVTALILLLLSILMLKVDLPGAVVSGGIIAAYIISNFVGGFLVGKKAEMKKFLWGLLLGIFYFILLMVISLAINKAEPLPLGNLMTALVICGLSGMVGGMLS